MTDEEVVAALDSLAGALRESASLAQATEAPVARLGFSETPPTPAPSLPTASAAVPLPLTVAPIKRWQGLPGQALFAPPLANPNEPRFFAKATSLENVNTKNTADVAIGGLVPVLRYAPTGELRDAVQLDFFASVLSRFKSTRDLTAVDYRVGFPITWARGPWEYKVAYEHTSTHLGDEFILRTGRQYRSQLRDEVVFGAAYRFLEDFRVYGIIGYAANLQTQGPREPMRYDAGLEWSSPLETTGWGKPFAAVDLEMRGDQNYAANVCAQLGWQWRAWDYGPSLRVALEYFDGRSPFGQFFLDEERWFGVGVYLGY